MCKLSKRRGNITILALGCTFGLFIIMGVFILDYGFAMAVKSDLYNVANAAAMAGAEMGFDKNAFMATGKTTVDEAAARKAIDKIVRANQNGTPGQNDGRKWIIKYSSSDILIDRQTTTIKVTLHTDFPTSFMKLIGINKIPLTADATADVKRKK